MSSTYQFKPHRSIKGLFLFAVAVILSITISCVYRQTGRSSFEPEHAALNGDNTPEHNILKPKRPNKPESCTPVDHVVFLKTHKTASTTVAGIFDKYALKHHLNLAVPRGGEVGFNLPELFSRKDVGRSTAKSSTWDRRRDGFHMLTNHARYNRRELEAVVHNAKYITIVREPLAQFVSAFYYFHFDRKFPPEQEGTSVDAFFLDPYKNFRKVKDRRHAHVLYNNQLYDLGMDPRDIKNRSAVRQYINKLDEEFDLVLVSDYLDISLVLLCKLLCWNHSDFFYESSKIRNSTQNHGLLPKTMSKIRSWNKPDRKLYRFFSQKLWTLVDEYGESFDEDLNRFQEGQRDNVFRESNKHLPLVHKIVKDMESRGIIYA